MFDKQQRRPIVLIELATPDLVGRPSLIEKSWFLSGISWFSDLRGFFFGATDIKKDPSLGTIFSDVAATTDRKFRLELGVALTDLFPNFDGKTEYVLAVKTGAGVREVCISNVMARLRFVENDELRHALAPRFGITHLRVGNVEHIPKAAGVELLRTVATCRFEIEGANAEEALETHCESCIHDFIERLNRILKMLPFVDMAQGRAYGMPYSRATLPAFYFGIQGKPDGKIGCGWISPHIGRTLLNPPDLPTDKSEILTKYLLGESDPDDVDGILHTAQTYVDAGISEYVLLLSVIAAEVATERFIHVQLLDAQVSRSKLEESEKDLTYSMMLNVILFAVTSGQNKPDKMLIGKMNRARSLRNAYMHTGEMPPDHKEVLELFEQTKKYIEYLRRIQHLKS